MHSDEALPQAQEEYMNTGRRPKRGRTTRKHAVLLCEIVVVFRQNVVFALRKIVAGMFRPGLCPFRRVAPSEIATIIPKSGSHRLEGAPHPLPDLSLREVFSDSCARKAPRLRKLWRRPAHENRQTWAGPPRFMLMAIRHPPHPRPVRRAVDNLRLRSRRSSSAQSSNPARPHYYSLFI